MRQGRLKMRRNFFSNKVVSSWNDIPGYPVLSGRQQEVRTFSESCNSWEQPDKISRPTEQHLEPRRRSRAHPGPRCSLRGPTWAMGDNSTSKQVSSVADPWNFDTDPGPDCGSIPLTNGSGCGSGYCYFRQWPSRRQQKVFLLITFWRYICIIF